MKLKSIVATVAVAWIIQSARAQVAAPEKTAGEVLKNIQLLKDVPMSEWNDTMNFIGGALGVGCQHCHGAAFEKDDLKPKQTARAMIKMTREINAVNFGGHAVVTCNTCHQGALHPKAIPTLFTKSAAATVVPEKPNTQPTPGVAMPDVDQVMANYRKAVGPDARTLHLKGTVDTGIPGAFPFEIDLSVPDKVALRTSIAGADVAQVFNGDRAWLSNRGTTTELTPENMAGGKLLIDSIRPAKFVSAFAPRKVTGIEKIGDRTYSVVESRSAKRLERLYFDAQSGLLYKRYVEAQTAIGATPSEILFEDYREVNGVKLPFLMTIRTMSNQADYKFSEIQTNVTIDFARFEKPVTEPKK
jgi:Photosynthetic reaction centre cytochrome C subunit